MDGGREDENSGREKELLEVGTREGGEEDKDVMFGEPTERCAPSNFNFTPECFPLLLSHLSVHLDLSGFIPLPCDTEENVLVRTTDILDFWNVAN